MSSPASLPTTSGLSDAERNSLRSLALSIGAAVGNNTVIVEANGARYGVLSSRDHRTFKQVDALGYPRLQSLLVEPPRSVDLHAAAEFWMRSHPLQSPGLDWKETQYRQDMVWHMDPYDPLPCYSEPNEDEDLVGLKNAQQEVMLKFIQQLPLGKLEEARLAAAVLIGVGLWGGTAIADPAPAVRDLFRKRIAVEAMNTDQLLVALQYTGQICDQFQDTVALAKSAIYDALAPTDDGAPVLFHGTKGRHYRLDADGGVTATNRRGNETSFIGTPAKQFTDLEFFADALKHPPCASSTTSALAYLTPRRCRH